MPSDAVIGGSGLESYPGLVVTGERRTTTAFGEPSAPLVMGDIAGRSVAFLSRHGPDHGIAPHRINYRANVRALRDAGVERVYAVAAVGGIAPGLEPGAVVVPDQLIDYTVSRTNTFFDGGRFDGGRFDEGRVVHVDMTHPYTPSLRNRLLRAAAAAGVAVHDGGVYGVTEGPRFETTAEIDRMERDGCTVVGMTAMPEAALARELGMEYAACAVVSNAAAGRGPAEITMEDIYANLERGMREVRRILAAALAPDPD